MRDISERISPQQNGHNDCQNNAVPAAAPWPPISSVIVAADVMINVWAEMVYYFAVRTLFYANC